MNKYIYIGKGKIAGPVKQTGHPVKYASLPTIEVIGNHSWNQFQILELDKDFRLERVITGGRSIKSLEGIPYDYETYSKEVAISLKVEGDDDFVTSDKALINHRCYAQFMFLFFNHQ